MSYVKNGVFHPYPHPASLTFCPTPLSWCSLSLQEVKQMSFVGQGTGPWESPYKHELSREAHNADTHLHQCQHQGDSIIMTSRQRWSLDQESEQGHLVEGLGTFLRGCPEPEAKWFPCPPLDSSLSMMALMPHLCGEPNSTGIPFSGGMALLSLPSSSY